MKEERSACFFWNCVAGFRLDDKLARHLRHEVNRLCRLSTSRGVGKNHLLVVLEEGERGQRAVELSLRHGGFIYRARETDVDGVMAFEAASKKIEEAIERRHRYEGEASGKGAGSAVEPFERTDEGAPRSPADLLREMAVDYLRRMRRYARRRLQAEALLHPDWPVGILSDGDVVDEALIRLSRLSPSDLPFGAFWPKAIECCDEVLAEHLTEAERAATSTVSLDADLPDAGEWDSGYDPERPDSIIDRLLFPPEEELEDATPDQRSAAPSTIAEYEDYVSYIRELMSDWPKSDQRLIDLYCFEGMSAREIAAMQNVEEAEILPVLKNSLRLLQQALLRER